MALLRLDSQGNLVAADSPRRDVGRHRQPGRSFRNTARWKRLSARVVAEEGRCRECPHTGSPENPLTADHILPVAKGGAIWERSNLQCLCRECNSAKGSRC